MRKVPVAAVAAALLLLPSPAGAAGAWRWPLEGEVVRGFAVGPDRFAPGQHRGIDVAAPIGTRVLAACGGRVRHAGLVGDSGRTVSVVCGPHAATYLHLQSIAVRRGALVAPGALVGTVGRTGRPASGVPHLHLGAREVATDRYVDPRDLLAAAPPGVPVLVRRSAPRSRSTPLGPAPRAARAPRAAPAPRAVPVPRAVPAPAPAGLPASRVAAPTRGTPLVAWLGLGLAAAGLPVAGLARARRRPTVAPRPLGRRLPPAARHGPAARLEDRRR